MGCVYAQVDSFSTATWFNAQCSTPKDFICEIERSVNPTDPTVLPTPAQPLPCDPDEPEGKWITNPYDSSNEFCYHFETVNGLKLSWGLADQHCSDLGGRLASIHSDVENDFVMNLAQNFYNVWVGLARVEDGYAWSDGSPYEFVKWQKGGKISLMTEKKNLLQL